MDPEAERALKKLAGFCKSSQFFVNSYATRELPLT
jgi:hypothetical protein